MTAVWWKSNKRSGVRCKVMLISGRPRLLQHSGLLAEVAAVTKTSSIHHWSEKPKNETCACSLVFTVVSRSSKCWYNFMISTKCTHIKITQISSAVSALNIREKSKRQCCLTTPHLPFNCITTNWATLMCSHLPFTLPPSAPPRSLSINSYACQLWCTASQFLYICRLAKIPPY